MLALISLSLGLAMDAFAVSLARGACGPRRVRHAIELGLAFGLAQGLMPLFGWGLGLAFTDAFRAVDHWIAFVLLVALGVRMLVEANAADADGQIGAHGRWLGLLTAAFATSVDAAAAGLALPMIGPGIAIACATIGVTTAILCTLGYLLGARASARAGKAAEMFGGIVLIALGTKILIEHLTAAA